MGVGAALYMCDVVVKKFTFAISSHDEFLFTQLDCVAHTMHLCAVFLKEKNCHL